MTLQLTRAARAGELLTTAEAKDWLRVDHTDDDALIDELVKAVADHLEAVTNRALVNRVYTQYFDAWADEMPLHGGKVSAVSSVEYRDADDVLQTVATTVYELVAVSDYGAKIIRLADQSWPTLGDYPNPVKATYTAGYGPTAASVPDALLLAARLHLSEVYERREVNFAGALVPAPAGYYHLIGQYRVGV